MKIDQWYKETLMDLNAVPIEVNKRTGVGVRALPGVTFETDLERDGFPLLSLRKVPLSFIPEIIWFLSGSDNIKPFLQKHTKIWDSFAKEDGQVTAAYGKRWARSSQFWRAVNGLKADSSTRHSVVVTWDVDKDPYGHRKQKNVPCPVMFTLNIIRGRLHMHVIVRSNDMVLGFPTDVAGFALLQEMIAQHLGVQSGKYTHSISNCHYYENQQQAVDELLVRPSSGNKVIVSLPINALERACKLEEGLVDKLKEGVIGWNPGAPIKNIPIAI